MIYFAQAIGTDRVKIGYAEDVRTRIAALETGSPFPLDVIRTFDGTGLEERWLHKHYAARRVHREWFRYCDEMLAVKPPALAPAGDGAGYEIILEIERRAKEARLPIKDLCARAGIARSTFQRIKSGFVGGNSRTIAKLLTALGCDASDEILRMAGAQ